MYAKVKSPPKYLPSDIIAGVLAYADCERFTGNPRLIHETIYKLRKKYELLKVFPFSKYDVYPFSRELEKVLFALQRARIIGMENPDFQCFVIKEKGKKYIDENILVRFSVEEKNMLNQIGKKFKKKCSTL